MKMIQGYDIFGKTVSLVAEGLLQRPAAYAVIIQDGKILLHDVKTTKQLWLPGGGVKKGEVPQLSIPRELKEEVGIDVAVGKEYYRNEYNFLYNPSNHAYRCINTYYLCRIIRGTVDEEFRPDDGEAERPHWREIRSLHLDEFHPTIHELVQKIQQDFSS